MDLLPESPARGVPVSPPLDVTLNHSGPSSIEKLRGSPSASKASSAIEVT
ncbi:hypothetical protein EV02_1970 [Prochlorococcus marinus str. SB]|uniref:Uncharacterized protein n=1 Tax=Prochlorococcus marinus str. SB TaxID=59926 RepID=A0A0A2B0N7_PROMR|nr:hypothetical protein EV02_1970 [Prochlorococcus marinus str. SB]